VSARRLRHHVPISLGWWFAISSPHEHFLVATFEGPKGSPYERANLPADSRGTV
jgi:hypothetical protein